MKDWWNPILFEKLDFCYSDSITRLQNFCLTKDRVLIHNNKLGSKQQQKQQNNNKKNFWEKLTEDSMAF